MTLFIVLMAMIAFSSIANGFVFFYTGLDFNGLLALAGALALTWGVPKIRRELMGGYFF